MVWVSNQALAQEEGQEEEVNTGQDFTKPLTRFDLRQKYQDLPNGKTANQTTLRIDKPIVLKNKWVLSLRADLPFISNNVVSMDNPTGDTESGVSDFLNQVMFIAPQGDKNWTWAYGAQVLWPTASQDQMGTGRFQIAPLVGAKVDHNTVSQGSFSYLLVRNHIVMWNFIQTRDLNDDDSIGEFANIAATPKRLSMLYILTYCDIR